MIYVSQGHEHSVALEIFFKSFLMLTKREQQMFTLIADKNVVSTQKAMLGLENLANFVSIDELPGELGDKLKDQSENVPLSTWALEKCLERITSKDILITLPTSKDQLIFHGQKTMGYTDFFRRYFNRESIAMVFSGGKFDGQTLLALITDHIPLAQVPKAITEELIIKKVDLILKEWKKVSSSIREVLFCGINPPCWRIRGF